jgi:DNA-binding transcriptional ArsR family regulator
MPHAVLTLSAADALRCRFVSSLLSETMHAVRTLVDPAQQQFHANWLARIDPAVARSQLPTLLALSPRHGWTPDFVAPPPQPIRHTIDDELAQVASYPPELVAADLQHSLDSAPTQQRRQVLTALIAEPVAARSRLVAELAHAWQVIVEPYWPSVCELIDADVAYRSTMLGRAGLGSVLADLHRDVRWVDERLIVKHTEPVAFGLAGQGLALLPSAFVWPRAILVYERPWSPTLIYPARGVGELWTAARRPTPALVGVLGRTRALLLLDLGSPATTTALAARHRLSPAATSTQLVRLRDARLIVGKRIGKEVHYRRTPLGDQLVDTPVDLGFHRTGARRGSPVVRS